MPNMAAVMQIIFDQETGRPRGFGFVKFDDQRDAEDAAIDANNKVFVSQSQSFKNASGHEIDPCFSLSQPIVDCNIPPRLLLRPSD